MNNDSQILIAAGLSATEVFDLAVARGVAIVLDVQNDGRTGDTLARLLDKCYSRAACNHFDRVLAKMADAWRGHNATILVLADADQVEPITSAVQRVCNSDHVEVITGVNQ